MLIIYSPDILDGHICPFDISTVIHKTMTVIHFICILLSIYETNDIVFNLKLNYGKIQYATSQPSDL